MSIQNIQTGDLVPIELQLADGAIDQYPRALVYDQDSLLLITIDLSHDYEGNYSGTSYNLPDKTFVKVVYIVYSDAPHTTENTKYERDMEVFYQILPDEFKADVSLLATAAQSVNILIDTASILVDTGLIKTELANPTQFWATPASLESMVNAEVVDVMKTDTVAEMAQGALPLNPSMESILNYLYRKLRNHNTADLSMDTIYADDGTTELFKAPLSDDNVLFTKSKYISGA